MKKTLSVLVLVTFLLLNFVDGPSLASPACPSGYMSNGYFGGSWFDFSSNSVVQGMISSGEMTRIFTTNGDGISPARATQDGLALACIAPSFSIQSSGSRGLYLVGSGWVNAAIDTWGSNGLVSLTNSYLASNFIYPTTTAAVTTTTAAVTTTTAAVTTTTAAVTTTIAAVTTTIAAVTTTTAAVTTTTAAVTTTTATTIPSSSYYCLKPGGIGVNLVWKDSRSINFVDPLYFTTPFPGVIVMSFSEWSLKSQIEKNAFDMNEVAIKPVPSQGCSSLNEVLVLTTTTTIVATTTTAAATTTTVARSSATTTIAGRSSATTTTLATKSNTTNTTSPKVAIVSPNTASITSITRECAPNSDLLYIYNYFTIGEVTNLGGRYDPGLYGSNFDWTRNCKVAPITKIIIQDNYSTLESNSLSFRFNFNKKFSNCWQIARVSSFGQSDWSNQVCYTAPVIQTSPSTTVAPPILIQPAFSKTVPKGAKGAQCFDGYRTKVRNLAACSTHFGRDYWLFKTFTAGYNYKYLPSVSINSVGAASGKCVGICYGVPSSVNGLPRNTYVSGYFKSNGTYVSPYTRSKP